MKTVKNIFFNEIQAPLCINGSITFIIDEIGNSISGTALTRRISRGKIDWNFSTDTRAPLFDSSNKIELAGLVIRSPVSTRVGKRSVSMLHHHAVLRKTRSSALWHLHLSLRSYTQPFSPGRDSS